MRQLLEGTMGSNIDFRYFDSIFKDRTDRLVHKTEEEDVVRFKTIDEGSLPEKHFKEQKRVQEFLLER